jgi:succinate-semialdehyde dehydrogenase/glutarate-semialdehyde dehydrogenase
MTFVSTNPATGARLQTYAETSASEIDRALDEAARAQGEWATTPLEHRAHVLLCIAADLRDRAEEHARLMAQEMGKPLPQGRAEVEKCARTCEHYAAHGAAMLAAEEVDTEAWRSYTAYEPLGSVLAVMPWNFPYWQVLRFAAPNLMAGNAILLKHAANVCGTALELERLIAAAGVPRGLFRALLVPSEGVADLIADQRIHAVTLTGSTAAGRSVAAAAGRHLKKTVMELGGSDAYVVLADADLDHAAATCAAARLVNTGQSCIAAKRMIVEEAVRVGFVERFVSQMARRTWGPPLEGEFDLGPLARLDLRDELHAQVQRSLDAGASLLLGGEVPDHPGAFYPPTVLGDVRPGMAAFDEETFGPVAAIVPAADEDDALRLANLSPFGLGGAVFTRDVARGDEIARHRLQAGSCFVNAQVHSDPRLPFGGVKLSGYGRELGTVGIREFVNVKTVLIERPDAGEAQPTE